MGRVLHKQAAEARSGKLAPMVTAENVMVAREGAIAVITLNRPSVMNALNNALFDELEGALETLGADDSVRAIILTGAGDRAFAAGADIAELSALPHTRAAVAQMHRGQRVTLALERSAKPVVAAVNGFALGGGCELALACDIRIASERAKFGQPEVNLGLMPGYGGTQRLTRLIGRGMALYLCLTGEVIDAAEALRIGLVQKVVPAGDLLAEARRVAGTIAEKGPLGVAAAKRAIDEAAGLPLHEALRVEALYFATLLDTNDFKEGTRAFLEKRKPAFTGS
jgi:enoyl-CoA hydratase